MFIDRLTDKIRKLQNPTVMGLDPKLEYIPFQSGKECKLMAAVSAAAESILNLTKGLLMQFRISYLQ